MRKILRRMTDEAAPAEEAARRLNEKEGITVLDEKPSALLVEGESDAISAIAKTLWGWSVMDFSKVSRPDTRARVKERPADD